MTYTELMNEIKAIRAKSPRASAVKIKKFLLKKGIKSTCEQINSCLSYMSLMDNEKVDAKMGWKT